MKFYLRWFAQNVSHTAHSVKEALLSLNFKFLSQVPNIYFNNIALATKIVPPDPIEYHLSGQHLAGMPQEKLKQLIFFSSQGNDALSS
jgi:hypothetical protein